MAMVRNGYGTKIIFTMVRNGRYEMVMVRNDCNSAILCDDCCYWYYIKCIDMPILEYNNLSNSDEDWYCRTCTLPNFSDSYFDHNKSFDGTSDHEISYTGNLSNINITINVNIVIFM